MRKAKKFKFLHDFFNKRTKDFLIKDKQGVADQKL